MCSKGFWILTCCTLKLQVTGINYTNWKVLILRGSIFPLKELYKFLRVFIFVNMYNLNQVFRFFENWKVSKNQSYKVSWITWFFPKKLPKTNTKLLYKLDSIVSRIIASLFQSIFVGINPLMPRSNKRSYVFKQAYN